MHKSTKIQKMINENNIERDNYTLVIRLKGIVENLNAKIAEQDALITSLKKDTKSTKINEMEIEIQHLNDENKRLVLLIDQCKPKVKSMNTPCPKKCLAIAKTEEKKLSAQ